MYYISEEENYRNYGNKIFSIQMFIIIEKLTNSISLFIFVKIIYIFYCKKNVNNV